MSPPLGIGWHPGSHFGYGVLGLRVSLEFARSGLRQPVLLHDSEVPELHINAFEKRLIQPVLNQHRYYREQLKQYSAAQFQADFPILHALSPDLATCLNTQIKSTKNFGLVFAENTKLMPGALEHARLQNKILAGSTWCADHLKRSGVENVHAWTQGVDTSVFCPGPRNNYFRDRFVIFSGGKLEFRKGQDLVLEAFRQFHLSHPDALLMTCWGNPWPETAHSIERSTVLSEQPVWRNDSTLDLMSWIDRLGISKDAVYELPVISNSSMGQILREADVALFPNRCEAGTNLVAMEALATGIPTILSSNTGHLDLLKSVPCYRLEQQQFVEPLNQQDGVDGWGESSVDEILEMLERIYRGREDARRRGQEAAHAMAAWDWKKQVPRLIDLLEE